MIETSAGPSIELLLRINAAFNARDVDRIMSFFEEDATFLMARGPEACGRRVRGKAAIRKVLADRFTVNQRHALGSHRALRGGQPRGVGVDGHGHRRGR